MRKLFAFGALAGVAVLALAQVRGTDVLAAYAKALNASKSVSATLTVQPVGGTPSTFKVNLAKPNMARIDTPSKLVVSDGTTITTYDKQDNSFYKQPYDEKLIKNLLNSDELGMLAPFFDANAYAKVPAAKNTGVKNRKGVDYTVVQVTTDSAGRRVVNFYIDPKDSVAHMSDVTMSTSKTETTSIIVMAKDFTLNGEAPKFSFVAPEGAREMSLDELSAGKWYGNMDEAMAAARKGNKKIFVDFMASWCGPCKMLAAAVLDTPDFKKMGKYFVFARIDVDEQPATAQKYNITAMPTQMVLDANGGVIGQTVGYGGPQAFYSWINQYAN